MRNALTILAALAMLAFFAWRTDRCARSTSQTFDEAVHLTAGYSYWKTGDFRMNRETPPLLKLLWALPLFLGESPEFQPDPDQWERNDIWRLSDAFLYESGVPPDDLLLPARRVNIAVGLALVALIGWWAKRMWGVPAGLLACALASTDPNLAGQSAVLSTDIGLSLFCAASAYALWEYSNHPRGVWFCLAGISFGLALTTKFSALAFAAACGLGSVYFVMAGGSLATSGPIGDIKTRDRLFQLVGAFVRLGLIAFAVIVIAYFGTHALDWPRGLKQQLVRGEQGDPHYFLDGEISSTGWLRYFPEVLAFKTPIGTILLAVVSLTFFRKVSRRETAFLFLPAMLYLLVMCVSRIDIGWRVILPTYPAIVLLAARSALMLRQVSSMAGKFILATFFVSNILPSVFGVLVRPSELSYSSGLLASRTDLHRHLGDSNIDWGQGLKSLQSELVRRGDPVIYFSYAGTARPEAYGIRFERLPSWGQFHTPPEYHVDAAGPVLVAISVSNLQGTYLRDPTLYHWLLEREPISRTDGSIWLFDLTEDVDARERIRKIAEHP